MAKTQSIPCNGQKLKREFEKRNVNMYDFAMKCGYSRKWVANAVFQNYVTPPMLVCLQDKLNITMDDIKLDPIEEPTEKPAEEKQEESTLSISTLSQGDLYETISDAVTDALRGMKAEMQRIIFDAMRDALKSEG